MNENIYSGVDGGDLAGRKQDILFLFVERSRGWKNDIEVKEHDLSRDLSSCLVCAKFRNAGKVLHSVDVISCHDYKGKIKFCSVPRLPITISVTNIDDDETIRP